MRNAPTSTASTTARAPVVDRRRRGSVAPLLASGAPQPLDQRDRNQRVPPRPPSWWRSPRAWWAAMTPVQRVEVHTLRGLEMTGAMAPLLLLVLLWGDAVLDRLFVAVFAAIALQTTAAFFVVRAGLEPRFRPQTGRAVVALVITTSAAVALAAALPGSGDLTASDRRQMALVCAMALSPAVVCLVHRRIGWLVPLATGAAIGREAWASGAGGAVDLFSTVWGMVMSASFVAALRASAWLLDVVRQLAAAQADQARLAVAEERLRFARDLHDVVSAGVSAMVLHAAGARALSCGCQPRVGAALEVIEGAGGQTMDELHQMLRLLRASKDTPSAAHGSSRAVLDEVPQLLARARQAGLEAHLVVHGEPAPVDPDVDLAGYRLVQEALTNTAKHAGAGASVTVELTWEEHLDVRVRDTGGNRTRPPQVPAQLSSRIGLVGLAERVALAGGHLHTAATPDGFVVQAQLPLRATAATEQEAVSGRGAA